MLEACSTSVADGDVGGNDGTIEIPKSNSLSHQFTDQSKSLDNHSKIRDINGREVTKIYKLGEKGSGIRLQQGEIQDFFELRAKCLSQGILFEDPEFPALDSSIFVQEKRPAKYLKEIEWIRPKDISDNPQLFVDGPSRSDPKQGFHLNNCWFVSSLSIIAMHPKLLNQVLPQDQNFGESYAGIFHVRFWQFGKWIEVVIDDRLPMYDGKLLCGHSENKNEFWSSIIEKAYAKLHGYWEALEFGFNREALEDLTGGISQLWKTDRIEASDLFDIIHEAHQRNSLIGCIVEKQDDEAMEKRRLSRGLIVGHAYSVTKVMYLERQRDNGTERIPLLRLRNPLGYREWNGAWNDNSSEWNSIARDIRDRTGFESQLDGEFWISLDDWMKNFDILEICYLNLNFLMNRNYDSVTDRNWEIHSFEGEWVIGASAGGSTDDLKKFQHNPQYRITLNDESTLIIALMQRNRRTQRKSGAKFLTVGFDLYKLPEGSSMKLTKPLNDDFFGANQPVEIYQLVDDNVKIELIRYFEYRQASCRIKLGAGNYFIIPSTAEPNLEGEFLIRVFSQNSIITEEYDDEIGEVENTINDYSNLNGNEVKLRNVFRKLAGDDWEFDWREQKEILDCELGKELSKEGFGKDSSRSMIALLDADNSGKVGFHEFKKFWNNVERWKAAFKNHEDNGSGYLKPFRLREVLKTAGYRANKRILNLLLHRYGTEDGHIKFDDYFMCALRLDRMIDAFQERASSETRIASLTIGEWIEITLKT